MIQILLIADAALLPRILLALERSRLKSPTENSTVQLVTVLLNGQPRQIAAASSVAQLLTELGLAASHVAVELNLQLVPRAQHAEQSLAEGDRVEIVTLVGGG